MPAAGPSTARRSPRKAKVVESETKHDPVDRNGIEVEGDAEKDSDSDEESMIQARR